MKIHRPKCPQCGEPPRGTVETVSGCALLNEYPEGSGFYDYDGETKIWWDEQKTITSPNGRARMICYSGHEWWSRIDWNAEPDEEPGQPAQVPA